MDDDLPLWQRPDDWDEDHPDAGYPTDVVRAPEEPYVKPNRQWRAPIEREVLVGESFELTSCGVGPEFSLLVVTRTSENDFKFSFRGYWNADPCVHFLVDDEERSDG